VVLTIQDNGIGFDREEIRGKAGLGLASMRERVSLIQGELFIRSEPGHGTRIEVYVPRRGE
jgi:signal transduction histidine kinase